jgi:hypothetical protein
MHIHQIVKSHRYCGSHIEPTCTASLGFYDMGLTSAEGKNLECFKSIGNNIDYKYDENIVNPLCSKVMVVFYLTQLHSM